jgi:PKD repeat protein
VAWDLGMAEPTWWQTTQPHIPKALGLYTVKLTASSQTAGQHKGQEGYITVSPPEGLLADFVASPHLYSATDRHVHR